MWGGGRRGLEVGERGWGRGGGGLTVIGREQAQ